MTPKDDKLNSKLPPPNSDHTFKATVCLGKYWKDNFNQIPTDKFPFGFIPLLSQNDDPCIQTLKKGTYNSMLGLRGTSLKEVIFDLIGIKTFTWLILNS